MAPVRFSRRLGFPVILAALHLPWSCRRLRCLTGTRYRLWETEVPAHLRRDLPLTTYTLMAAAKVGPFPQWTRKGTP
ncbi:MAG: hypothetical protein ACLR1T_01875 [Evtepia gabavorous]